MSPQSVKDKAREQQRKEFEAHADIATPELQALTLGIYDQIDVLDAEKRSLLIQAVLGKIGGLSHGMDDPTEKAVFSTLAGIGNYANEVGREVGGMTSTGDVAVDSIMEDIAAMLKAQFTAVLGDAATIVQDAADRVKARVEAGEDFERVAREEETAMRKAIAEAKGIEVPAASDGDDDPLAGLYL